MQLLFSESEEFGRHTTGSAISRARCPVPSDMPAGRRRAEGAAHGVNDVEILADHPVLEGIPSGTYFYFVHSYYAVPSDPADAWCRAPYGGPFTAAVGRGNRIAVQFHPEKSQAAGLRLLGNFGRLCMAAA